MNILVTGGAGYIGSHTLVELINEGHNAYVVDDLSNSSQESLRRVESITSKTVSFAKLDLTDKASLVAYVSDHLIDAVIHFAGLKAVGESVAKPLLYYRTNIDSTLTLLEVMDEFNIKKLVFSSSSTVYGQPDELPLTENSRIGTGITNPYGWTKFMIEQILRDWASADTERSVFALRYFNPVGAHPSGLIGEDPKGVPNNLLPYIAKVAIGEFEHVGVFGNDYDTPDGSGVRDYIHVVDLAKGHTAALSHLSTGYNVYNLCTGKGVSVFELIDAFSRASSTSIPFKILPRRAGDVGASYASPAKANRELQWKASLSIDDACADTWRWQTKNPNGYRAD